MADSSTGHALQSFLETYGSSAQSDIEHIPNNNPQCCCGNTDCAYLEHNQTALDDLERELQTSARLGQALLVRHESYMADAERQRQAMAKQMEELESEKKSLQVKNNNLVQENRGLLDQLEALNNAVAESDVSIANLQATLQSTQLEVQKLSALAARTESLERELALFESEQATWQVTLRSKEQAEKTAMRRWHDAERTLAKLQDELERIERESTEERERHGEVVARMERRHAVEKELVGAEHRLKGPKDAGPNVVSHFVKDILQDNATLQMGIVELREMLQNSNEEVEKLRDQLMLHQPADDREERRPPADRTVSLGDELNQAKGQELHVHHHYHAPAPAPAPQRSTSLRRVKKKRLPSGSSAYLTPTSSGRSTPRSSISLGPGTSAAAILRQTAVSLPQDMPHNRRWSAQSAYLPQAYPISGPSSPTSTTNRASSVFDKVFSDAGNESTSPPTSDGEGFSSPNFMPLEIRKAPRKFKGHARGWGSGPGKQSLDSIMDTSIEDLPPLEVHDPDTIEEETEAHWDDSVLEEPASAVDDSTHDYGERPWHRPALRRAASHESLLSVSGMDIHTLKERPSQLLIPNSGITTGAVVTNFQVHAATAGASSFKTSSKSLLSGMAAEQRKTPAPLPGKLTKKGSGWFFGRWGATPESTTPTVPEEAEPTSAISATTSAAVSDGAAATNVASPAAISSTTTATRASLGGSRRTSSIASSSSADKPFVPRKVLRSPGINQPGAILGFLPETKIQHPPVLKSLDQDALTNVLDDT